MPLEMPRLSIMPTSMGFAGSEVSRSLMAYRLLSHHEIIEKHLTYQMSL
jgi:hypothetical protein